MSQTLYEILQQINPNLAELTIEIEKLIFISLEMNNELIF